MQEFGEEMFLGEYNENERTGYMSEIQTHGILSPEQRFIFYSDVIAKKLINEGVLYNIPLTGVGQMINQLRKLPYTQYKNPLCSVIGFALTAKNVIDVKMFRTVLAKLKVSDPSVTGADILRYCNLWLKIKTRSV